MRRVRAPLALPVLLACALLASLCGLAAGNVLAPPLVSPPREAPFVAEAPIPAARTAYVAIHYEDPDGGYTAALDTEASREGIRVMMRTVADPDRGNSQRARVVLVPAHTGAETRRLFEQDGLLVLDMDGSLPHKDVCAPKFDRIYLWSRLLASRYDRVVYLDWDVVVQSNMDSLFKCGKFCMVFNSILHFVDGVMVVKPDPAVFDAMVERYKRERLSSGWSGSSYSAALGTAVSTPSKTTAPQAMGSSASWHSPSKSQCWEKSYIFFLFWFGNIEAAPLFNAEFGQSPLPLQRMSASVQLNAMMWYEKYSWTLMRGKEYRNMTNDQEVPALSLGYTTLKPFHWVPSLFFNLGWDWSALRDQYFGLTHTWFCVSRTVVFLFCLLLAVKGIPKCMQALYVRRPSSSSLGARVLSVVRAAHMAVLGPTGGYVRSSDGEEAHFHSASMWSLSGYWLPHYGSDLLGILIGGSHAILLGLGLTAQTSLIPMLTAPHFAWRCWFAFHVLGVWAFNHWLHQAYHACPPLAGSGAALAAAAEMRPLTGGDKADGGRSPGGLSASSSAAALRSYSLSSCLWLAFWEVLCYVLMRRTFYPEFVVKMLVLFPLLAAMLIASINMNREVWGSIAKAQKIGQQAAAAAAGMAQPDGPSSTVSPLLPGGGRR